MIEEKDIKNLLTLARIKVTSAEEATLLTDVRGILGYIGEIQNAEVPLDIEEEKGLRNVLREDGNPHEAGEFTEAILREAPNRQGDYIAVKKIL